LNFKCNKHKSNEGYFEGDKWICWECITSDLLKYPIGRVIDSQKRNGYILRVVDGSKIGEMVRFEIFKDNKFITVEQYRDLSQAIRRFDVPLTELNMITQRVEENREERSIDRRERIIQRSPRSSLDSCLSITHILEDFLSPISDSHPEFLDYLVLLNNFHNDRHSYILLDEEIDRAPISNKVIFRSNLYRCTINSSVIINSNIERSDLIDCLLFSSNKAECNTATVSDLLLNSTQGSFRWNVEGFELGLNILRIYTSVSVIERIQRELI